MHWAHLDSFAFILSFQWILLPIPHFILPFIQIDCLGIGFAGSATMTLMKEIIIFTLCFVAPPETFEYQSTNYKQTCHPKIKETTFFFSLFRWLFGGFSQFSTDEFLYRCWPLSLTAFSALLQSDWFVPSTITSSNWLKIDYLPVTYGCCFFRLMLLTHTSHWMPMAWLVVIVVIV